MEEPDFRSDKMDSAEGRGIARRAWDAYAAKVNKRLGPVMIPIIRPGAEPIAREWVEDMLGFWIMWHLYGGFEGLEKYGFHRATIYRKIKRFRIAFGVHPDEFKMDGVIIDAEAYWKSAQKKVGPAR